MYISNIVLYNQKQTCQRKPNQRRLRRFTNNNYRMTRIDKEKNINKVAVALLNNPLWTQREIAKSAWIPLSTANRAIHEVGQSGTKSETIEEIISNDTEITRLWQKILVERMRDDKINNRDILTAVDQAAKRRSIFIGNLTDEDWGLKDTKVMSIEELLSIVNK